MNIMNSELNLYFNRDFICPMNEKAFGMMMHIKENL